jgi:hypothetical protein
MEAAGGDLRGLTDRDQITHDMQSARSRVLAAIAGLTDEQASSPAEDGWSVKDHLNHLTMCDEIRFFEIGRVARGGAPAFQHFDGSPMHAFNETIAVLRRDLSLEQALSDLAFARSLVLEAIAGAPEHALDPRAYGEYGYAVNGSIEHDHGHAEAIEARRKGEGA